MGLMEWVFFLSFLALVWLFFGYGMFVFLWSLGRSKSVANNQKKKTVSFTIIMTVHNEEKALAKQLDALLALDYPQGNYDILVASDGSTDATETIAKQHESSQVHLLSGVQQRGKTHAQNLAIAKAKGEWLLFMDAGTVFPSSLLADLNKTIAEEPETTACIQPYFGSEKRDAAASFFSLGARGIYDAFEQNIKKKESLLAGMVSVAGLCYAVRRDVCPILSDYEQSDFATPLALRQKGYRTVLADSICVYETYSEQEATKTFRLRHRVCLRALHTLKHYKGLCRMDRYGLFSLQLISHKWLRYTMPFLVLAILISSVWLGFQKEASCFYHVIIYGQLLFYGCALIGYFQSMRHQKSGFVFSLPYYITITFLAYAKAWFDFLQGRHMITWSSGRGA